MRTGFECGFVGARPAVGDTNPALFPTPPVAVTPLAPQGTRTPAKPAPDGRRDSLLAAATGGRLPSRGHASEDRHERCSPRGREHARYLAVERRDTSRLRCGDRESTDAMRLVPYGAEPASTGRHAVGGTSTRSTAGSACSTPGPPAVRCPPVPRGRWCSRFWRPSPASAWAWTCASPAAPGSCSGSRRSTASARRCSPTRTRARGTRLARARRGPRPAPRRPRVRSILPAAVADTLVALNFHDIRAGRAS